MVNPRREFFRVSLDEIKAVVRQNFDKTVEFTDFPDAEQWRVSMKMRGETTAQQPQFPENIVNAASPAPVNNAAPKNLAQTAIEIMHEKYPAYECTYTEKDGIYSIVIKNHGRLRISNHRKIKCDYFGQNGMVAFAGEIRKICDFIG